MVVMDGMEVPSSKRRRRKSVILFVCVFTCIAECVFTEDPLLSRLHHYETMQKGDVVVHHVEKRSIHNVLSNLHNIPVPSEKIVSFNTLGREFRLCLYRHRSLLSADFRARLVDERTSTDFPVSQDQFFKGTLEGDAASKVTAYWEDGHLVATIRTTGGGGEVYSVEPAWRHLGKGRSDEHGMIAYRASDVKKQMEEEEGEHGQFCGYVNPEVEEEGGEGPSQAFSSSSSSAEQQQRQRRRGKRQAATKNTCTVVLVADYKFYEQVGGSDEYATANYLIGSLSRVDDLYRATDFDDEGTYDGVGFEIKQVIINTAPTDQAEHYNMERTVWDTKALLKAFSKDSEWGDVCMAHLFTATAFSDGVLGLGWVASSNVNSAGGLCSPVTGQYYYNTAWTSAVNKYGNRLLTQETDLVTAHEFGHNWGTHHDPDTAECAPGQMSGGSFLMYTYAVSGYDRNNDLFSPCSKRAITAVLDNKAANCFTEASRSFCGNYAVEEDEECDAGRQTDDPCCDIDCKLKTGAVCSDKNSACCESCQVAVAGTVCSSGGSLATCTDNAFCNGTATTCPNAANKVDDTACIDGGLCRDGACLAFCESQGLLSCKCDTVELSCQTCCKSGNGTFTACTPYALADGSTFQLSDGKTCVQGSCEAGVCIKEIRRLSDRLWNVLENFDVNTVLVFMKDNIVLTTMILSLVLYVPLCLVVYCIDKRNEDEDDEEVRWRNRENEELMHTSDNRRIMQSYTKRRAGGGVGGRGSSKKQQPSSRSVSGQSAASTSRVKVHPVH